MIKIKEYLNQLSYLWEIRSTFKALFAFIVFLNIFFSSIVPVLYFILNNLEQINTPENFKNFIFISIAVWGILHVIVVLIWLFWRKVFAFPVGKIGILFAPHADSECNDLIIKLFERFTLDLSKKGMDDIITYRLLPQTQIVKNNDEARELLHKTNARLIIHGFVQKGKIKNEEFEGFKSITFLLKHRNLEQNEIKPVTSVLANALAYRAFIASESNSFIEKQVVIENLSEVASFFISMGLTLEGKLAESHKILLSLKKTIDVKLQNPKHSPQLKLFKNSIIRNLTVTLNASYFSIYRNHLIDNITSRSHDKYAKECMSYLSELVLINRQSSDYLLKKAIIHFHFGEITEAFACVKKAKKLAPRSGPGVHFSLAFLHMWTGDYIASLKEYKRASRYALESIFIMDVLLFLQSISNNNLSRFEIIYALGFVNEKYFDKTKAISDYTKFIRLSDGIEKLIILRDFAINRLKTLK